MNITQEQFEMMVEEMTTDLIRMLVEQQGLTIAEAFSKVYTSPIYEALRNPDSTLYFQSPGYVYSLL